MLYAVTLPVSLPWNAEVSIVGLLVVIIMLISFGVLTPRPYVKRLEKRMDFDEGTIERNTVALENIALALKEKGAADDTVGRIMAAIQAHNAEQDPDRGDSS